MFCVFDPGWSMLPEEFGELEMAETAAHERSKAEAMHAAALEANMTLCARARARALARAPRMPQPLLLVHVPPPDDHAGRARCLD